MNIYKIYKGKVCSVDVNRETKRYFWFTERHPAFGFSAKIEKEYAYLSPQEAIQEALNKRKTMREAFKDKLSKIESEIANLEKLEQEYNKILNFDGKKSQQAN